MMITILFQMMDVPIAKSIMAGVVKDQQTAFVKVCLPLFSARFGIPFLFFYLIDCILFLNFLAICGDGHTVLGREECDDGVTPPHPIILGCSDACTVVTGWNCLNDNATSLRSNCTRMIFDNFL